MPTKTTTRKTANGVKSPRRPSGRASAPVGSAQLGASRDHHRSQALIACQRQERIVRDGAPLRAALAVGPVAREAERLVGRFSMPSVARAETLTASLPELPSEIIADRPVHDAASATSDAEIFPGVPSEDALAEMLRAELAIMNDDPGIGGRGMTILGEVEGKIALVLENGIGSGQWFARAAEELMEMGTASVYACVTHAASTAGAADRLAALDDAAGQQE